VAIPAVMMFNYLTNRVEAFDVEMDNSSSELVDYFLKPRTCRRLSALRQPTSGSRQQSFSGSGAFQEVIDQFAGRVVHLDVEGFDAGWSGS